MTQEEGKRPASRFLRPALGREGQESEKMVLEIMDLAVGKLRTELVRSAKVKGPWHESALKDEYCGSLLSGSPQPYFGE